MRGDDKKQAALFSYVSPESRVPKDHPLRTIREMVDKVLVELSESFEDMYASVGRPSIPPEKLLRAYLLQMLFSVRSERMLMEQLNYNILFRWFIGLDLDDPVWNHSTFSKNRDRLIKSEVAILFLDKVVALARKKRLLSSEHFTVDGTLIEAWASAKSFKKKDSNPTPPASSGKNDGTNFRGEKRSNDTHASTTDPDSRLYKKAEGKEAKLSYMGHLLTENRNGLIVNTRVTHADGTSERKAAIEMVEDIPGKRRVTLGADKGYDAKEFVKDLRDRNVTPHVSQNDTNRNSNIDKRTTRHPGYPVSQRLRKKVEEVFGWMKTVATMRKTKYRGKEKVAWVFAFAAASYNLVRICNLEMQKAA